MKKIFILSLSALIGSSISQAQTPYFLDPNFGNGGVEVVRNNEWTPQFGPYVTYKVRNMIVGADDKIWLSGNVAAIYTVEGVSTDHALTRLLPNGKPDSSFNGTGHINFGATNQPDVKWLDNMVLLPDNKLLYAGNSIQNNMSRTLFYKVNNNGTFDNSFGTNGVVRHSGPLPFNELRTLDVQSTGKIIALTASFNQSVTKGAILRLNSNGSIDNTFGNNGYTQPEIGFPDNKIYYGMMKVLPDNSFLVVGTYAGEATAGAPPYSAYQDFIAKFSADGILQTSFGTNGKTILPKTSSERLSFYNKYVDIDPNGTIYINCSAQDLGSATVFSEAVTVYKLSANGTLVSNYGQNGRLGIPGMHAGNFYYYDAQLQQDNRLLVAAMTDTGMNAGYRIKRINTDGSDDLTFTGSSASITGTRNALDHFHFLGMQSNNKIIVGGWGRKEKSNGSDTLHPVIMRLTDHETVDTSTAVVNIRDQQQIKVFPNPMGNNLYIHGMKANASVRIFDISGKAILKTTLSAKSPEPVDCSKLAAGIYWLQLKEERSATIYTQKLIKQ